MSANIQKKCPQRQSTEPVPQSDGEDHHPMNVTHEIRRFIVENILFGDENRLDETTSFEASGIFDSLGMIELITFVENKFGIEILDTEIVPENLDSVRRVAALVERKLTPPTPH
jgi:acyl carrier protein